ncbi:ABC transporter ATP-binding protein [Pyrofollis japonicus]|uniref:ABC transporter ATP-binding protein n=1 Tax=Pyrofollis japonicus TaxID=3060460 RepID=UPI00295AB087|nr:ABC transporter ATP-binding protein [Pyrofollis japonicus]BEP17421.1 ABC transporter ATP-binding protein [Pyrofollis japonicus]
MPRRELVVGEKLKKYFVHGGVFGKKIVRAVDGVDITVYRGETLALVGESGCGKSTLGRLLLRLYEPTSGKIVFDGVDITHMPEKRLRPLRKRMQLIPQDPYASFNPLKRIGEQLEEPLLVHKIAPPSEARRRVLEGLEEVGLVPAEDFYRRYPYQLSGGQLQRAAIVRAMLLEPDFIVADEPTSSLDVSVRAGILRLLKDFKDKLGGSMLFITHDLATAKLIADRIAVMYLGKIVELGPADKVLTKPLHPYTAALLTAIPRISRRKPPIQVELKGDVPDPSRIPKGCRLHPRCPFASEECKQREPELSEKAPGHYVACHHPLSA